MIKHTPGPWKAVRSDHSVGPDMWWITAGSKGHNEECDLGTFGGGYPEALREANARLAAAAPELLDALQDTLNMLRAAHIDSGVHHNSNKRVIKARDVLVKARGEA